MKYLAFRLPPDVDFPNGYSPRPAVVKTVMWDLELVLRWSDNAVFWMTAELCNVPDGSWWSGR